MRTSLLFSMIGCAMTSIVLTSAWAYDEATVVCSYPTSGPGGVWLANNKTAAKHIWGNQGQMVAGAFLSPDGKTIAINADGKLYIVNNDGLVQKTYDPGPNWPPIQADAWQYTSNGVFWVKDLTMEVVAKLISALIFVPAQVVPSA